MAEPYIGEIRLFAGNYAPKGWALCNGQTLPINQNQALYSILGVTYGGNGITTFQLPNLQSRIPIHPGQGQGLSPYQLGQSAGNENITLTQDQLPMHAHNLAMPVSSSEGETPDPTNAYLSNSSISQYALQPNARGPVVQTQVVGGSGGHPNLQPTLCVNFIIALTGIFPARN